MTVLSGARPVAELAAQLTAVANQDLPIGLGSCELLAADVADLAAALTTISTELARRMVALESASPPGADTVGTVSAAGVPVRQARALRRAGLFVADHPGLEAMWFDGHISTEQVVLVARGCSGLSPASRSELVGLVSPHLPSLTARETKQIVAVVRDQLLPGDPDHAEADDYRQRSLNWSQFRGGISFTGYLPALEGGAFMSVINAFVESLRTEGDGHTMAQRRADALATLVAKATADDVVPNGGGLPAAVTLTVSLTEAERIAQRDPVGPTLPPQPRPANSPGFGDAATRFALCCSRVTPVLADQPGEGSLLAKIGKTRVDPLEVGRAVRLATAAQRKALQLRDRGCLAPGCSVAAAYTQPHHVVGYSLGGLTDLQNLASLCWAHHRQVEIGQLTITKGSGGHWEVRPRIHYRTDPSLL